MEKLYLNPGSPDDDNRDYLPEKIKGSDIVVNESGNNSQPYPSLLKEFHESLVSDEIQDTWYEYVPSSYVPGQKTPLVVSLHGGLMTGWGQAIYSSWTILAEMHNFIVAFPDATKKRVWCVEWGKWHFDDSSNSSESEIPPEASSCPEDIMENHDIRMILELIKKMKSKYSIDEGRIYMQGMSMGNLMTALFSRHFGSLLAGAAGSGCSTFTNLLFEPDGSLKSAGIRVPIWQSRPENNDIPPEKADALYVNKYNKYYWMKCNDCNPIPQIRIEGENNLAFYHGKYSDQVYLDIKNRDHGQSFDDAALIWNYLFSGVRRNEDGAIICSESNLPRIGDKFAFAVAQNCSYLWFNNSIHPMTSQAIGWQKLKYHGLNGGQKVRGEYCMVPLSLFAQVFNCCLKYSEDTLTAKLVLQDGRILQFARGSIGCVINDRLRSMYCEALHKDNQLFISVEWFCRYLMNLTVTECDGVVYVTDHFALLSANMADLIKDLLCSGGKLPDYEALKLKN